MTNLEGKIQLKLAQLYSLRNWIEYGFKQVKNELGWADYRLTDYPSIERWWSIIFSAYLLVSIHANNFDDDDDDELAQDSTNKLTPSSRSIVQFQQHRWWENTRSWKSTLNNLRLIIQPYIFSCLITPWLEVFKIPGLRRGLCRLIYYMNDFRTLFKHQLVTDFLAA